MARLSLLTLLCLATAGCDTRVDTPVAFCGDVGGLPAIRDARSSRVQNVVRLEPGQTIGVAELAGPGAIRHWWWTARGGGQRVYKDLVLRIWWDGEPGPSVEVPLGDLLGIGWGEERDIHSAMAEMIPAKYPNHAALNLWWPMPFESARIELEHQGTTPVELLFWIINYEKLPALPEAWGRFHAQWRRQNPVPRGGPYVILDARGCGHYVGTIMNYHLLEPGSWVEGGESFFVDDDALTPGAEPTLQGIGSEDYFGLAWGYRRELNLPYHGTAFGPVPGEGPVGGRMSAYRYHVRDPIRFNKAIRVEMCCHGWDVKDRSDDYSSVAIWYQREPHAQFPPLPPRDARVPAGLAGS